MIIGAIGLGFGVSLFDGIYEYAEAATEEEKHALLMKGSVNFMGCMAKEITPNDEFYVTTYSSDKVPAIDPKKFSLRIEGLVERPYTLTLKDIEDIKDKTAFVTLECIGNSVGRDAISNALWDGVTLKKIIDRAVPKKGIVKTAFFAEDGYSDSIPYSLITVGRRFSGIQDERRTLTQEAWLSPESDSPRHLRDETRQIRKHGMMQQLRRLFRSGHGRSGVTTGNGGSKPPGPTINLSKVGLIVVWVIRCTDTYAYKMACFVVFFEQSCYQFPQ